MDEELFKKAIAVADAAVPGFAATKSTVGLLAKLCGRPDLDKVIADMDSELLEELLQRLSALEGRMASSISGEQGVEMALNALFEARRTTSREKRRLLLDAMEGCLRENEFDSVQRKHFFRLIARLEIEHIFLLRLMGGASWITLDDATYRLVNEETMEFAAEVQEGFLPGYRTQIGEGDLCGMYVNPEKVAGKHGLPPALFIELMREGLAEEREDSYRLSKLGGELLLFLSDEQSVMEGEEDK